MPQDVWEQEAAKMEKAHPGGVVYTGSGPSSVSEGGTKSAETSQATSPYQGVSAPPNEGNVTGEQGDFGPQDPAYKLWAQKDQPPEERYSTRLLKSIVPAAEEAYTGAAKGIENTLGGLGNLILRPFVSPQFAESQKSYLKSVATPKPDTFEPLGYGAEQAAEFMAPGGLEERGALKLAELAPKLGRFALPAARVLTSGAGGAAINAAQGGSPVTGVEMGAGGALVGGALQSAAPAIAESGLRVRGNQRLFGRTPGEAILQDTKGVRPATIARSAQQKINQLEPQIAAMDAASVARGDRGSLAPAREAVENIQAGHRLNRAMDTVQDIQPIADFLNKDKLTGQPLAEAQSAPGLRNMKRGLNTDYIGKWSLEQPAAQKGAARRAYGELNQELHYIVPESKDLDQRVSSLIPVVLQGKRIAAEAPTTQRALGRFAAHTGALTLGGIGGMQGYREGGVPGAIVGGLTGIVAPELVSSPEGQMMLARTLYRSGALRPIVGAGAQFTQRGDNQQ